MLLQRKLSLFTWSFIEKVRVFLYKNQLKKLFFVHYINLNHREDRKIKIESQLNKYEINFSRLNACRYDPNGKNSDFMNLILSRKIENHLIDNDDFHSRLPGLIGCYASHVKAIMSISQDDNRLQLIMEDDININSILFYKIILKSLKKLPNDWDILALDVYGKETRYLKQKKIKYPRACYPEYYGAQALLINSKNKLRILKILEETRIKEYDCLLFKNETAINTYILNTGYCSQDYTFTSDISI